MKLTAKFYRDYFYKISIFILLGFSSCSISNPFEPSENIVQYTKNFISILQNEGVDSALRYANTDIEKTYLVNLREEIKLKRLIDIKIINYSSGLHWSNSDNKTYYLYKAFYQFNLDNTFYGLDITIKEEGNNYIIKEFKMNKYVGPINESNSLSFKEFIIIFFMLFIMIPLYNYYKKFKN